MSTATTSDKFTSDKYTQIRGELRGLLALPGHGSDLWITTTHPGGAATALFRLNLDSGELHASPLGGGAVAIVADDSNVFLAGTDGHVYRGGLDGKSVKAIGPKLEPAPTALALAVKDRLAVVCGKELVIVARKDGKEIAAPAAQRDRLGDHLRPDRRVAGRRWGPRISERVRLRGQGPLLRGRVEEVARGRGHRAAVRARRAARDVGRQRQPPAADARARAARGRGPRRQERPQRPHDRADPRARRQVLYGRPGLDDQDVDPR